MTIIAATHMFPAQGLEYLIFCADSQLTLANHSKSHGQKIVPAGKHLVTASGILSLIHKAFAVVSIKISVQNVQTAGDLASQVAESMRGYMREGIAASENDIRETTIMISGPVQGNGHRLGVYVLNLSDILDTTICRATEQRTILSGSGASAIPPDYSLELPGHANEADDLIRTYTAAYLATRNLYCDDRIQIGVQTASESGTRTRVLLPPDLSMSPIRELEMLYGKRFVRRMNWTPREVIEQHRLMREFYRIIDAELRWPAIEVMQNRSAQTSAPPILSVLSAALFSATPEAVYKAVKTYHGTFK
ncbi:hypothetical protein HY640_05310 [Candidatus Woesearchaeota archaeon]|nr:hypothetical protein [Candidatus Woesearchaeota archaeon]